MTPRQGLKADLKAARAELASAIREGWPAKVAHYEAEVEYLRELLKDACVC